MQVEADSPLVGKSIEAAGLRHLPGLFLAEIDRDGNSIPAVSPREVLQAGDRLLFVGVVESIVELQRIRGLVPATEDVFHLKAPRPQRCLIEAVVSNTCPLIGKTIRDARFRSHYNAVVVAVARNGQRLHQKIGDIILHAGDVLLVEAHPSFAEQHRNSPRLLPGQQDRRLEPAAARPGPRCRGLWSSPWSWRRRWNGSPCCWRG